MGQIHQTFWFHAWKLWCLPIHPDQCQLPLSKWWWICWWGRLPPSSTWRKGASQQHSAARERIVTSSASVSFFCEPKLWTRFFSQKEKVANFQGANFDDGFFKKCCFLPAMPCLAVRKTLMWAAQGMMYTVKVTSMAPTVELLGPKNGNAIAKNQTGRITGMQQTAQRSMFF